MAKTSKSIPQKYAHSSSRPTTEVEETAPDMVILERTAVGEKKRRRAPSSPSSEKKKPRRKLICKPKKSSSSRVPDSDSLYQLRDEPDEDKLFVASGPSPLEEQEAIEQETCGVDLLQIREIDEEAGAGTSQDTIPGANLRPKSKSLLRRGTLISFSASKREGEFKKLRAELDATQKEHANLVEQVKVFEYSDDDLDMATNGKNPQVAQDLLKDIVEYVKRQSHRKALEKVHARGSDLSAEIENSKKLEAEAKNLAFPEDEEGFEGYGESEKGENPDGLGDEVGSGEDQAA
uniref:Interactor of constitutive active ROPs 3-like n=1 Tax=Nicotiana sylvestris TaxID=4096 RepID=A0A1U7VAH9_NICSY|nr:PREDICTED: interactor of constitutive active ROPs 3-like [Nicotiana sylvestris]